MTSRSDLDHRKRELAAAAFGFLANRGLSRKVTGVDKVAKKMIASKAGTTAVAGDPDLVHPDDWDRPID